MDARALLQRSTRLHSAAEIDAAMQAMAAAIAADLGEANPVVVAIMSGGAFTAVNLCRWFAFPYEFDFVHVGRYGRANEGGQLQWHVRPSAALAGRTVLLVDDVLDKGTTLAAVQRELRGIGVAALRTAVLVCKRVAAPSARPQVDYHALESDDVFLFGCGMDYAGFWRGLPELYAGPVG